MSTFAAALRYRHVPFPARIDPEALGDVALAVVESRGFDAWSLRDVARELGVSPNALYRHVGSREGLLVEAGARAAEALAATLRRGGLPPPGHERAIAIARRYVRFGLRRPHAYAAIMSAKPELDHPRIGPWLSLWAVVQDEVAAIVPGAADAAAFALWALVHGRVQLAAGPARTVSAEAGLDDAVRALLTGFEVAAPIPSPLPPELSHRPR